MSHMGYTYDTAATSLGVSRGTYQAAEILLENSKNDNFEGTSPLTVFEKSLVGRSKRSMFLAADGQTSISAAC